ncbi:hypothetical protein BYT27DRAFT_7197266 [Phlegmacium glaucopus]|nr:hypothetical protein BYT27DRAFT_7197266 [Phlegmacium glaucopus]
MLDDALSSSPTKGTLRNQHFPGDRPVTPTNITSMTGVTNTPMYLERQTIPVSPAVSTPEVSTTPHRIWIPQESPSKQPIRNVKTIETRSKPFCQHPLNKYHLTSYA